MKKRVLTQRNARAEAIDSADLEAAAGGFSWLEGGTCGAMSWATGWAAGPAGGPVGFGVGLACGYGMEYGTGTSVMDDPMGMA